MNRFLRYCFENFARPLIFFGLTIVLVNVALLTNNRILQTIAGVLLLLAVTGIFGSMIYLVFKKRWQELTVTALIFGLTVFLVYLLAPSLSPVFRPPAQNPAEDIAVPENIAPDTSAATNTTSSNTATKPAISLDVYGWGPRGNYKYDVWINKTDSGIIYLKAFDTTGNKALSADSLLAKTSLPVYNPADTLVKFSPPTGFIMYEGEAGKPYTARFELWFKPTNGGPEVKLLSRNFTIEGGTR